LIHEVRWDFGDTTYPDHTHCFGSADDRLPQQHTKSFGVNCGGPMPDRGFAPTDRPDQITFKELEALLRDDTVPERELRKYFDGDPEHSHPFSPVLKINRARVQLDQMDEFRVEGAFAMNWANGASRLRRQARFERRRLFGETLPVLASEGDSWFQFPILLEDIIDQLDGTHLVWCVSAAGDTVANMALEREYVDAVRRNNPLPKVFLFSGGGNDVVGSDDNDVSILKRVVRPFEPNRPAAWYIDNNAFEEKLAFVERMYREILDTVERTFGGRVSVITHGYDRAIPWRGVSDPRQPAWAKPDEWLGAPLNALGIADKGLQREIVGLMIDRLNEVQQRLCGGSHSGGVFPHAFHVDLRGTLPNVGDWADELHPTDAGFVKVTGKVAAMLQRVLR
jgi:hypothetical protein